MQHDNSLVVLFDSLNRTATLSNIFRAAGTKVTISGDTCGAVDGAGISIAARRTSTLAIGAVGGIGGLNINDSAIDLLYGSAVGDDGFVGTTTQDRINNKSGNDKLNDA